MNTLAWLVIPGGYLIGGLAPGYWIVRWRTGADVRAQGSGATGATNAARVLGRGGFVAVLALDAAKGALIAGTALLLHAGTGFEFAAATAVIAGHVWPIQLGFRGGRGFGPLLGAWLVLAPIALLACGAIAALTWAISHRRVASGLFGTLLLPIGTWQETGSPIAAAWTTLAFVIVAFAHRPHIRPDGSPLSPT